jgi:hypothetical protein
MLIARYAQTPRGKIIHAVNETLTARTFRTGGPLIPLCGERIDDAFVVDARHATCGRCAKLDDPFNVEPLPKDPRQWVVTHVEAPRAGRPACGNQGRQLIRRDLLTEDGALTPRGIVLHQDMTSPCPWPDDDGTIHDRWVLNRGNGVCGAALCGVEDMTYARLAAMLALRDDMTVTCLECIATRISKP